MAYPKIDPATGLEVKVKDSASSRVFRIDMINLLGGRTIATLVSIVSTNQNDVGGSTNVVISLVSIDARYAYARIAGGTNLERYRITATITDSEGNALDGEGMLYVRD